MSAVQELTVTNAPAIRALDPLDADAALSRLPDLNAARDAGALVRLLAELVARAERPSWRPVDAAAAMRDLGMLLASIRRAGVDPVVALPLVEPLLLSLGATCEMGPRETAYHYCTWNPTCPRERRFTRDPREGALIEAARVGAASGVACTGALVEACHIPFASRQFADTCRNGARHLFDMVRAISGVREHVGAEFFARELASSSTTCITPTRRARSASSSAAPRWATRTRW